ncbi:restriction endonuclease subunit S [Pseudomonas savastanoi]|uniref:Restriction modification system DNA specificity domain n=1 Tax=Pseudomonas savastanoi TaxID=29438 RepID=A0A3M6A7L7_PSESS|nr:restriction endonuclease subunit S [Pseudomonas savastanoi]KPX02413.1 hypothetical protein ALO74_200140 [Pseudomonas syringae pv. cunninghamiae]RMV14882.1 Restriction modification system DNA specificity domain [Pseudomonas savastanoi]RMV15285.1 Restriction modification system DNA specificity domain [Pseudomonas savastanoi]
MTNLGRVSNTRLPTDWTVVALGDLLAKLMDFRGRTPKKLGMDWGGGAIPALSANNVRMGFVDFKRECYLGSEELYKAWMVQGDVKRHDLVFTMEAPLGNVAVISDDRKYILSQRVVLLRPNSKVQFQYLFQYLRGDAFTALLDSNSTGTTAKGIQQKRLVQLPVVVPPIAEQQKIAAVLTAVDDKLKVIARQIEATQALKQGLMQTLFSRGVGTQDATGRWIPHTEFKESELGEIPEGWSITTLGAICNGALQTGPFGSQLHAAEYQDEGTPVLMPKDLLKCRANLSTAARIAPERAEELAKHKLVAGDLLFSRRGDVARFALIDEQSAGALCGTGCLKAKPSEGHSSAYIAHLLQLDVVRAWLEQNAVGQTMPNMNTAILASLPLVAPANKQEQEEIAGILDSVDAKAGLLFSKRLHYQTLKRGLMQKLLTGEWRVKLDSPTGIA